MLLVPATIAAAQDDSESLRSGMNTYFRGAVRSSRFFVAQRFAGALPPLLVRAEDRRLVFDFIAAGPRQAIFRISAR